MLREWLRFFSQGESCNKATKKHHHGDISANINSDMSYMETVLSRKFPFFTSFCFNRVAKRKKKQSDALVRRV
jgi:hypothetical protein